MVIFEKWECDICKYPIRLSPKSKYELERDGWLVYCSGCAERLKMNRWQAKVSQIKIYKINGKDKHKKL